MADEANDTQPPEERTHPWKPRFAEFINATVKNPGFCKECEKNTVVIADDLVTTPNYTPGTVIIGGAAYPHAMLICTTCGNTRLFNAVLAGLVSGAGNGSK